MDEYMRPNSGPKPLNEHVRKNFQRQRSVGTAPELQLRRELFRRGLRFRVDYKALPGRPDIVFTRARIAVFVDGCFWHGCPIHGSTPKNNSEWWQKKIARNRERDSRRDQELWALGWIPLRYWEHDDAVELADEVEDLWRQRREEL